ncbi:MAG: lmo0937 family membrane protein [Bacteroidota bacterium]|nr:lmo0937 family membrane protein [Bacteroidota bacterium]
MGNLLYTIAIILLIIWAIGFFGFQTGSIIHVLLVIAAIAVIFRLLQGRRVL